MNTAKYRGPRLRRVCRRPRSAPIELYAQCSRKRMPVNLVPYTVGVDYGGDALVRSTCYTSKPQ